MNQIQPTEPKKTNLWLWIAFIIVVLIGAVFFGWRYYQKIKTKPAPTPTATTITTPAPTVNSTSQDLTTANNDLNKLNSDLDQLDKIDATDDDAPTL